MNVATLPDDLAEALADALGRVVADVQREWRRDVERLSAESRTIVAELRADVVMLNASLKDAADQQVARVSEAIMAIPVPQDGAPGKDGVDGRNGDPGEPGSDGAAGTDGKDADPQVAAEIAAKLVSDELSGIIRSDVAAIHAGLEEMGAAIDGKVTEQVSAALAALPAPEDGEPGRDGADGQDGAPGKDGVDGASGVDGKDGEPGLPGADGQDGAPGKDGVDGASGVDGKDGEPGRDGADGQDGAPGKDGVDGAVGIDGKDGEPGLPGADGQDGAPGERGSGGPVGKFVAPKAWAKGIHYESALVAHAGSTYCALRDTADEPPHEDWALVAARGDDAPVGEVYGLYDETKAYRKFDWVTENGSRWQARDDNPGPLPGDGWAMAAKVGKPGRPGEPGPKGDPGTGKPGPPGATIVKWVKDGYQATPMMSDGTVGPALDVREFFELYHGEAG